MDVTVGGIPEQVNSGNLLLRQSHKYFQFGTFTARPRPLSDRMADPVLDAQSIDAVEVRGIVGHDDQPEAARSIDRPPSLSQCTVPSPLTGPAVSSPPDSSSSASSTSTEIRFR